MNLHPIRPCLLAMLAVAGNLPLAPARAGLSEATDFDGPWTTAGTSYLGDSSVGVYWGEQSATSADGTDAVEGRLGSIDGDSTWMETTVTGPATLFFSYRVKNFTAMYSTITGSFTLGVGGQQTLLSASTGNSMLDSGWREASATIPAGVQTVRWKLEYFRGLSDVRAYVDQVWTSSDPRPRLSGLPGQTCQAGTPFSLAPVVASSTPATLTAIDLPPGLVADPTAFTISGTPSTPGVFEATLIASNAAGQHFIKIPFEVAPEATSLPKSLEAPTLVFSEPAGSSYWGGVLSGGAPELSHDGVDAARASMPMRASDPTWLVSPMTATVIGPGQLSFWYRTDERSSPADWCRLDFSISPSGSPTSPVLSGRETIWTHASFPVGAGPQVLTWSALRVVGFRPVQQPLMYVYLDSIDFTPTSIPPQPTFAAWSEAWAVSGQSAGSDTDADGLPLLMEYATGGSPHQPNPDLLPTAAIIDEHLTLRITKASSPTDVRFSVQGSPDLGPANWSAESVEILEEDGTHLLARARQPLAERPRFHLRVQIQLAP